MSTPEASRRFREAHPGYQAEYQRRTRAANPGLAAEKQRIWRIANPDRIRAYTAKYRDRKAPVRRARTLRTEYGMSPDDYVVMLAAQGGTCAICRQPETKEHHGKVVCLAVDHAHNSRVIRGLLCSRCNTLLGRVQDDPALLLAAVAYLERTPVPKK